MAATTSAPAVAGESPVTRSVFEEARRYIPGGTSRIHYYYDPYPIYGRTASGCRLTDVEGVERTDFLNNMTSLIHGHANPRINQAIIEQLERGTAWSEPSEAEVELAKLMVERVDTVEQIRFSNSGTEAVMLAIKLARAFTGRNKIAKFEGFYHGYYDHAQVSFNSTPNNWGPSDSPASVASSGGLPDSVTGDVLVAPYNDRAAVEKLLDEHRSEIAAFITDPLANRAGFPMPAEGFPEFLREITRDYGIPLIFDEVISFRVAHDGAQGKYGGEPDLTTFGKIMGGGLPVGAVGGRAEVMSLLDPTEGPPKVLSGGTFSANPLTMVAGLASMYQMTPDVYQRLDVLGRRLRNESNAVLARAGEPAQVTGDGSVFRIMMTADPIIDYRSSVLGASPPARQGALHKNLLDEGVILSKDGLGCLSTPMGNAEVDGFLTALERSVARLPAL